MPDSIFTDEERYRLLVEGAKDYAMILLDDDACIVGWNAGAQRIMGWSEAEVLGIASDLIFTPEDRETGVPAQELERAASDGQALDLRWHMTKDGTRFFADGIMEAIRAEDGTLRGYAKILRDATDGELARMAMRESGDRLRDAQNRLDAALSAGGIATWTWDIASNRVIADPNLAQLFSVSEDDAAGGQLEVYIQAIHRDDRERVAAEIGESVASQNQYSTEYRVVLPDGAPRWLEARGKVVRDASGQAVSLDGVVVDVTNRVERRARERFLAEVTARLGTLPDPDQVIAEIVRMVGQYLEVERCVYVDIDPITDNCLCHPDYRASDCVLSMAGEFSILAFGDVVTGEYAAGRAVAVDDVHDDPSQVPSENIASYDALGIRAHASAPVVHTSRLVSCIGAHSAVPRHWKQEELDLLQAVVERTWLTVEVLRQQSALAWEAQQLRVAHERTANILESIGHPFYTMDFEWRFTYINSHAEALWGRSAEAMLGRSYLEEFPEAEGTEFERQLRLTMDEREIATFEEYYSPFNSWFDVRAYPSTDGISIYFQDSTIRKVAEAERERLLVELRARAEREALINRISTALRSLPEPEMILRTAVSELGAALGAERCYYATYDREADRTTVGPEWRASGIAGMSGTYKSSQFAINKQPDYLAGQTQVLFDTQSIGDSLAESVGLRAMIRVSLVAGADMTALVVAMSQAPREWTPDDVALVEAVATQTQTALEAALLSRREHAIAQQLQAALQPMLPAQVPALAVGAYTKAALEESEVGGDFMDLFPLDKEIYALVVGDVSGKGLAAAQQLALIRNSLRTTLYLSRSAAQAVSSLNDIVTAHELLVGFVTAFVGVYDAGTGTVVYASCGHEPALVRRANGTVETLASAYDPPLGVDQNAVYTENAVTLGSGDTLLVYTDGISEAGPSRKELLGTGGIKDLFQSISCDIGLQECAETLVDQAERYAGGAFRDDVAVLLARRE